MASSSISVSELKCAVLDEAWRKKWLAGQKPATALFAPPGSTPTHGIQFHKDAEQIVNWLLTDPSALSKARTITGEILWQAVYDRFTAPFLGQLAADGKEQEALEYTERLQEFCNRLIYLRWRRVNFENWQDVFLGKEMGLKQVELIGDGYHAKVSGRIDAVRFHPRHTMEIVDYKLSQGDHPLHDMVQLAIYAKLMQAEHGKLDFTGSLEYYLPKFSEQEVSPSTLEAIYRDLVEPVLKELFPSKDIVAVEPTPTPSLSSSDRESARATTAQKIVDAFASFKLPVEVISTKEAPQFYRFNLKPGPGVKVSSLANRSEDLQVSLSLNEPPLVKAAKGCVVIDLPKAASDTVLLTDAFNDSMRKKLKGMASFPVGMGVDNEVLLADLADPNTCHMLVAGTSGSGKSEFLKSVVASLILQHTPQSLRFGIVDPKILTFNGMSESPFLWKPVITEIGVVIEMLREAVAEMDARYLKLAEGAYTSLSDRWKDGKKDLPLLVLVFDEFADLILADKESKKTFEELVARIAGKGRAAGIHLILATQRPDKNIVTGLIKANLPLKICLRVTSSVNSQIVLDEPGGESLFGRGDLLCDAGKGIQRSQSFFVPQKEFLQLCANSSTMTASKKALSTTKA